MAMPRSCRGVSRGVGACAPVLLIGTITGGPIGRKVISVTTQMAGMSTKETCTLIIVITPGINNSIIIMNK